MRQTNFRFIGNQAQFNDSTPAPSVGGDVVVFKAGGTLLVGDVVQLTDTNIVNKATTNPTHVVGVVVGGASTPDGNIADFEQGTPTLVVGETAATVNQLVYVMTRGVAYVVADGVVAAMSLIKQSAGTAGQVTAATADTDQGQIVGKLIGDAGAVQGDKLLILVALQ